MRMLASIPAIGDAIEALDHLCSHLSGTLKVITSLTAEIAAKEHIRVDNIQDVRLAIKK
jgi:nuclear pore complex protein Nup205